MAPVVPIVPQQPVQAPVAQSVNGAVDMGKLLELAKSSPDFNTFVKQALMVEGVMTDDQLLAFITSPDGFYAQQHA